MRPFGHRRSTIISASPEIVADEEAIETFCPTKIFVLFIFRPEIVADEEAIETLSESFNSNTRYNCPEIVADEEAIETEVTVGVGALDATVLR